MTPTDIFPQLAGFILACWIIALIGYIPAVAKRLHFPLGITFLLFGWLMLAAYICWMWIVLERPPLRTMGETKLWYSLFLPLFGMVTQWRWKTIALAIPTIIMAAVFLIISALHPENFDKTLMPALQSAWFVPHVIVYMISYAAFGMAGAISIWMLIKKMLQPQNTDCSEAADLARRLVFIAIPLLTAGLVFGALWAKVAWGNYWSWDPKESWAFLSWAIYIIYLHLQKYYRLTSSTHLIIISASFIIVLGCWFGINLLPTAMQSVHTYSN